MRLNPFLPRTPLLGRYPKELNSGSAEASVPHVHCGTVHNSQAMETSGQAKDRGTDQGNVVQPHNGLFFSL